MDFLKDTFAVENTEQYVENSNVRYHSDGAECQYL